MYGRWMDEPRLTSRQELDDVRVPAVVHDAVAVLEDHYDRRFTGLFCNFYRNGADSVAWHADRIGRSNVDPLVAIISLGGPRSFMMRDRSLTGERKTSSNFPVHSGDLLVMGGATQHHWEHAVPRTEERAPEDQPHHQGRIVVAADRMNERVNGWTGRRPAFRRAGRRRPVPRSRRGTVSWS